jgi:hypothetical protein
MKIQMKTQQNRLHKGNAAASFRHSKWHKRDESSKNIVDTADGAG